jgi:hypothetical protein
VLKNALDSAFKEEDLLDNEWGLGFRGSGLEFGGANALTFSRERPAKRELLKK